MHPATMTGVIDRLEKGGWIQRQRDEADRRAVVVSVRPEAIGAVFRHYDGMNAQMDAVCADYSPAELELIGDFLEPDGRRQPARRRRVRRHALSEATSEHPDPAARRNGSVALAPDVAGPQGPRHPDLQTRSIHEQPPRRLEPADHR